MAEFELELLHMSQHVILKIGKLKMILRCTKY